MRSTDIPTGLVFNGPEDNLMLVDFDEQGNLSENGKLMSIGPWLTNMMKDGRLPENAVVMVHTVEGNEQMLVKCLDVHLMTESGHPVSVTKMIANNVLPGMAKKM